MLRQMKTMDRDKLLQLKVYSKMMVGSAKWIDDRVMALMEKQTGVAAPAHPEDGLKDAFGAAVQDLENIKKIIEEFGILIGPRSMEEYRIWQEELYGEEEL